MHKRMLVLLDGSKLAEVVFTYAKELAGRLSLDVDLLHVCSSEEAEQLPMRLAYVEHMAEILMAQSEELRQGAIDKAGSETIKARGKVVAGYAPDEILKYVDENKIDIIMLSTHGRSGIRRWDLGSVADKVIHATAAPVWLVPAEIREEVIYDKVPRRAILIPLDGSKLAEAVIPQVEELAKQRGADTEIVLVNVADRTDSLLPSWEERSEELLEAVGTLSKSSRDAYLEVMVKRLKAVGLNARAELLIGDPVDEIIKYMMQNPTQLIALTTHGHTGFRHLIFADVTENLVRKIKKTPILLVRPPL